MAPAKWRTEAGGVDPLDGTRQLGKLRSARWLLVELAEADEPNIAVRDLIDDLALMQTRLNVAFVFPEELPDALERVWIRVVCRMLSGDRHCCRAGPVTSSG